jgi:ribosome-binding ATPase YchF (GTP1/OBG family)
MQEQEEEANTVIAQWQESFNESQNKCSNMCSQLEEELAAVKKEKYSLEKSLETIERVDEQRWKMPSRTTWNGFFFKLV